ncbi:hypothetical protein BV898_09926 [Hypsibius exemplaris]|uniref:MICOS complex subunit MIC19 n=1 Tax=Hypsibius exemplaris TaxID=2072580 RepID=A0A1W0WLC0_HYPEX|nr:hypothetical protein BV898_09926 [Hypsibius exemplaris]
MGNQQATRRVSFEREQTGLIAISDSVAQRLRNADGGGKSGARTEQKSSSSSASSREDFSKESLSGSSSHSHQPPPEAAYSFHHSSQPSPTQLEEQSKALAQLEEQWQERYKRLEGDTERIKLTSAEEFNKAVKNVETLFESKAYTVGSPDLQKAVMDCYKENTTRSLKCTKEADAFIKSIEDYKLAFLSKQIA